MGAFDIIIIALLALGAIGGFMRGFVQEIFSIAALFLAIIAIRLAHTPASIALANLVGSAGGGSVLALFLLFAIPYFLGRALARRLGGAMRSSRLAPIDRALGFGFGAIKALMAVALLFLGLVLVYDGVWTQEDRPEWLVEARTYPLLNASAEAVTGFFAWRKEAMGI